MRVEHGSVGAAISGRSRLPRLHLSQRLIFCRSSETRVYLVILEIREIWELDELSTYPGG